MVKALIVLGCVAIAFIDYCCCRAASIADQRMEDLSTRERSNGEV